ncbi:hypothetical protein SAMN02983003_3054 [Devosia enhydra]|uniref:Uncharacterized protein n=1 Tax=Devosia enhydra TaxID=665118 RepID=A0A1K2I0H4_9HYPH|nr:hypothetical protein [Devosia enhydra]SFZ85882.1 hypothetical protein SAMN02983003_3054 [Devosia enhydra]
MTRSNRSPREAGAEHAQVFRQFAWNIAGAIAPNGGRQAGTRNPAPPPAQPERS